MRDPDGPLRRRLILGSIAAALGAGAVSGMYLRVAMWVLVAINDSYNGSVSDHERAIYGQWTLAGTWNIVSQAMLFSGVLGGPLYGVARRTIGGPWWARGLAFGVVLLAVGGPLVLDPALFEYYRFITPVYAVALFAATFFIHGVVHAGIARLVSGGHPSRYRWLLIRLGVIVLLLGITAISLFDVVQRWRLIRTPLLPDHLP